MTGIMVQPVEKTARKAILPVLIEIVILNLILGRGDERAARLDPERDGRRTASSEHTGDMLKVIAAYYVGPIVRRRLGVSAWCSRRSCSRR